MKRILPALSITLFFGAAFLQSDAQNNRAFAITAINKGDVNWMAIREIDMNTGEQTRLIYSPEEKPLLFDAKKGTALQELNGKGNYRQISIVEENHMTRLLVTTADGKEIEAVTSPTATLVAASAFDAKSNRLFFTPMRSNELRYFDLNKGNGQVFYVRNVALKSFTERPGEADVITRMCIGGDGFGYALTNDANHLMRFSTSGDISIVDLGSVKDGIRKNDISIRDILPAWGGDMVADAFGNLYLISMNTNVFKINIQKMTADNLGSITGLPKGYTVNGAAVNSGNKVLISSATQTGNYFLVDPNTLQAEALPAQNGEVYNASDLASANILYADAAVAVQKTTGSVNVYPNPVKDQLNISIANLKDGNYSLQLFSAEGSSILQKKLSVAGNTRSQLVLPSGTAKGIYVLKIFDANGKEYYTSKLIVQ